MVIDSDATPKLRPADKVAWKDIVAKYQQPSTGRALVSGAFTNAGGTPASSIARWNASSESWTPLGAGVNGGANAIAILANGDIIAGGTFAGSGTASASSVARWSSPCATAATPWRASGSPGVTGRARA